MDGLMNCTHFAARKTEIFKNLKHGDDGLQTDSIKYELTESQ